MDLRSDTLTRPTAAMREAMARAEVGDDVFGEDPTVRALQRLGAELVGQAAALFVPSGTMANQVALLSQTRPGDEVLVGEGAHLQLYESGAGGALAGVQFSVVGRGGHFDAAEMRAAVQRTDAAGHIPPTRLVTVENTHNRGGGRVMPPEILAEIGQATRALGLGLHLDGARLFNAAAALEIEASAWGRHATSVSICLSKGLGAPVGSLLCGSEALIARAHRFRKMLGGGMRQAGIVAAGGLHALRHHLTDLAADHRRARALAEAVVELPRVRLELATVQSNILIFGLDGLEPAALCEALADRVRLLPFGPSAVRAVTHRDVDDAGIDRAIEALRAALS